MKAGRSGTYPRISQVFSFISSNLIAFTFSSKPCFRFHPLCHSQPWKRERQGAEPIVDRSAQHGDVSVLSRTAPPAPERIPSPKDRPKPSSMMRIRVSVHIPVPEVFRHQRAQDVPIRQHILPGAEKVPNQTKVSSGSSASSESRPLKSEAFDTTSSETAS